MMLMLRLVLVVLMNLMEVAGPDAGCCYDSDKVQAPADDDRPDASLLRAWMGFVLLFSLTENLHQPKIKSRRCFLSGLTLEAARIATRVMLT